MFRPIALIVAATLCLPAAEAARPDIRAIALEIPTGAMVRIKTTDKQTVQGKLTAVSGEGVTLLLLENDRITERPVPFSSIKSIQQTGKPMSAGKGVLIFLGLFYGVVMIASLIYAAVN